MSQEFYLDNDGSNMPDPFQRLRDGIERFFITDINNPAAGAQAQSTIAVMFDAWGVGTAFWDGTSSARSGQFHSGNLHFNHVPGGSNVLYMDGHVRFIRMNDSYPIEWKPDEWHPNAAGNEAQWIIHRAGGFG